MPNSHVNLVTLVVVLTVTSISTAETPPFDADRAFHDLETDWADSFRLGGIDFVDAILEGRQPALDGAEARKTLAFALAAGRSAAEGREVTIAEILADAARS